MRARPSGSRHRRSTDTAARGLGGPVGPAQICLGRIVSLDKPKTFDASDSTDSDGTIVRYEWDVDGDGAYELDTGADPKLTTTIRDEKPANLRVRVTDDEGASNLAAMPLTKLEPECVPA